MGERFRFLGSALSVLSAPAAGGPGQAWEAGGWVHAHALPSSQCHHADDMPPSPRSAHHQTTAPTTRRSPTRPHPSCALPRPPLPPRDAARRRWRTPAGRAAAPRRHRCAAPHPLVPLLPPLPPPRLPPPLAPPKQYASCPFRHASRPAWRHASPGSVAREEGEPGERERDKMCRAGVCAAVQSTPPGLHATPAAPTAAPPRPAGPKQLASPCLCVRRRERQVEEAVQGQQPGGPCIPCHVCWRELNAGGLHGGRGERQWCKVERTAALGMCSRQTAPRPSPCPL